MWITSYTSFQLSTEAGQVLSTFEGLRSLTIEFHNKKERSWERSVFKESEDSIALWVFSFFLSFFLRKWSLNMYPTFLVRMFTEQKSQWSLFVIDVPPQKPGDFHELPVLFLNILPGAPVRGCIWSSSGIINTFISLVRSFKGRGSRSSDSLL